MGRKASRTSLAGRGEGARLGPTAEASREPRGAPRKDLELTLELGELSGPIPASVHASFQVTCKWLWGHRDMQILRWPLTCRNQPKAPSPPRLCTGTPGIRQLSPCCWGAGKSLSSQVPKCWVMAVTGGASGACDTQHEGLRWKLGPRDRTEVGGLSEMVISWGTTLPED